MTDENTEGQPAPVAPAEPHPAQAETVDIQIERHAEGNATMTLIAYPQGPDAQPISLIVDVGREGAYNIAEALLGSAGSGYFRRIGTTREG